MSEFADSHARVWSDVQRGQRRAAKDERKAAIRQAVMAERERCAKIAEEMAGPFPGVGTLRLALEIAAKIRGQASKASAEGRE